MATLTGQTIASSYEQLLHVDRDGGGNTTTLVDIKDGDNGTTFALQLATDKIQVNGDATITSAVDQKPVFTISNTNDNANGAEFIMLKNPADNAEADADTLGIMRFQGQDHEDNITNYSTIIAKSDDVTNGTEDGSLAFNTMKAGSLTETMRIASGLVGIGTGANVDAKLHIEETASSTDVAVKLEATNDIYLQFAPANTLKWAITTDYPATNDFSIYNYPNNRNDLVIAGATGNATFAGSQTIYADGNITLSATKGIYFDGGSNTYISEVSSDTFAVVTGGTRRLTLDTNSRISLSNNDTSDDNTVFGFGAFNVGSDTGSHRNTAIGDLAMGTGTVASALNNVAIGASALTDLTGGDSNVSIGVSSATNITTGIRNIAIGTESNATATTASDIISIGTSSAFAVLASNTACDGTIAIGTSALTALTSGAGNVAIGHQASDALTTSGYNTVVGYQALTTEDVGTHSTAIGYQALHSQNTASAGVAGNTAVGLESGYHNVTGTNNTYLGYKSGTGASGESNSDNTGVGKDTLLSITSGISNVAIGSLAGDAITIGGDNVAVGKGALGAETVGDRSTAIGTECMANQVSDTDNEDALNVGIGHAAAYFNVTGTHNTYVGGFSGKGSASQSNSDNTGVGYYSLQAITTGGLNVAIGSGSADALTTGNNNVALGALALSTSQDIDNAIAIGYAALNNLATSDADGTVAIGYASQNFLASGQKNVSVGYESLRNNVIGDNNTAIGYQAMESFVADTDAHGNNTAVGHNAMQGNVTGTDNTAIGNQSAFSSTNNMTSGDNNTFIGSKSTPNSATPTNETVIGYNAVGQADNSVTLGNGSVTRVYMSQDGDAEMYANGTINTSDKRLKQDIKNTDLGLDFINELRPVSYKLKKDKQVNKIKYGIIAQEVQEVLKKTNNQNFAGITDKGDFLGADYVQFIAPLMKAIQELSAKVTELESKLN